MRNLSVIALLLFTSIYSWSQNVRWLQEEDWYEVEAVAGSVLYRCNEVPMEPSTYRSLIMYSESDVKEVRRATRYRVCGYGNNNPSLEYDTYVVLVGKKYYCLPVSCVENDARLASVNSVFVDEYERLSSTVEKAESELSDLLSAGLKRWNSRLDSLRAMRSVLDSLRSQVLSSAYADYKEAERFHSEAVQKEFSNWYASIPASTKSAMKTLLILDMEIGAPNSADGCDFTLAYSNESDKTIKYLTWYGTAYNAVDDPVYCTARMRKELSGKETGPIAPGAIGGGSWECVIYNNTARYMVLSRIVIDYMDGTSKTISGSDISRMIKAPSSTAKDAVESQYGSLSEYITKRESKVLEQIADVDKSISEAHSYISYYMSGYQVSFDSTSKDWEVHTCYKKLKEAKADLEDFKKENLMSSLL